MPDIVLFQGSLLKGLYEMALNYGFDYESCQEQYFILKMMQTALSRGQDRAAQNALADEMIAYEIIDITDEDFNCQLKEATAIFRRIWW